MPACLSYMVLTCRVFYNYFSSFHCSCQSLSLCNFYAVSCSCQVKKIFNKQTFSVVKYLLLQGKLPRRLYIGLISDDKTMEYCNVDVHTVLNRNFTPYCCRAEILLWSMWIYFGQVLESKEAQRIQTWRKGYIWVITEF